MNKGVLIIITVVLLGSIVASAHAEGGKVRGAKGKGSVVQVQVKVQK